MEKIKFNSESGISIVEILVVLIVTAILVTFAIAQFGSSKVVFQRQNLAREFKVNLERARFDSVKRNAVDVAKRAKVAVKANATSFDTTIDLNQNGTLEASDTRTTDFTGRSGVKIVGDTGIAGDTIVFPVTITFDQRGHITSEDSSATKKSVTRFIFCTGNCTVATANAANASVVSISLTGTVSMIAGGETQPTFSNPTVTNSGDYQINPDLLIVPVPVTPTPTAAPAGSPSGSPAGTPAPTVTATPTVTPTPTPVPTATPSPTVTPTKTPTPTPTATPSPTPLPADACTYGSKPKTTGCTCYSPMWVDGNGKCVGISPTP